MITLFLLFLKASLASAAVIILLLVTRKLFEKRIGSKFLTLLWFLVLIKLLVPVAPQSSLSLFNLTHQVGSSFSFLGVDGNRTQNAAGSVDSNEGTTTVESKGTHAIPVHELSSQESSEPASVKAYSPPLISNDENRLVWPNALVICLYIWLGGMLLVGSYFLIVEFAFRRKMRSAQLLENVELLSTLEMCKENLRIRKPISVYETNLLRSPCLYGVIRPKIYLPVDLVAIADSKHLMHILLHELTHYKRRDLWINALWTLSVCIHWFNPFVWAARKKMSADREIACDAVVLEALGEQEASSYGMTLLMMSRLFSGNTTPRINLSHFSKSNNETKRRIIMIAKFKKGSYKLSVTAILLIGIMCAVFLTNAKTGSSTSLAANAKENTIDSFQIHRPIDSAKWFNRLDRAMDFAKYDFKVPDYLPEGYQLRNVDLNETFVKANQIDLVEFAALTFVSKFGQSDEQNMEVIASKGKGTLLEHNLLWGADYSQEPGQAAPYLREEKSIGQIQGILYTTSKRLYKQKPETTKSFVWQDNGVTYAINYFSNNLSNQDLEKMAQSFTSPDQVQYVNYEGEGNSFPIYDETDLQDARNMLGFPIKYPFNLSEYGLHISDSVMQLANDQNTGFTIRPDTDTLWNNYRVPYNSNIYELNDNLQFFQSKAPIIDVNRLSFIRKLDVDGIEISAYADYDNIYMEKIHSDSDQSKFKTQTYYVWQQAGIYYTAIFVGVDKYQEENLKALVLAPVH